MQKFVIVLCEWAIYGGSRKPPAFGEFEESSAFFEYIQFACFNEGEGINKMQYKALQRKMAKIETWKNSRKFTQQHENIL